MSQLVERGLTVKKPVTTFAESVEAAKIISRAIADGLLDDAGETADITPLAFEVDESGVVVAVDVKIIASAAMAEGLFQSGKFVREVTRESDKPVTHPSPVRKRQSAELLETLARIPVLAAA